MMRQWPRKEEARPGSFALGPVLGDLGGDGLRDGVGAVSGGLAGVRGRSDSRWKSPPGSRPPSPAEMAVRGVAGRQLALRHGGQVGGWSKWAPN